MTRMYPIFFFAPAIAQFKNGEVGWGITFLCLSAALIIFNAVMDDIREEDRRKQRNER